MESMRPDIGDELTVIRQNRRKGKIKSGRDGRKMAEKWKGGSCAPPDTEVWLCHCTYPVRK